MFAAVNILATAFTRGNSYCSITIICSYRRYPQNDVWIHKTCKNSKNYTYQTHKEQRAPEDTHPVWTKLCMPWSAFKSLWPQMFTQVVSAVRSRTTDWILIVRESQETAYKLFEGKLNNEQIQANSMLLFREWTTASKLRHPCGQCCFPLALQRKKRQKELATDVN